MEKRSRRRIRDLVAPAAFQGLSQNEIGCARISMMARSTNAPFKGRIQKRKTNHLQIITFGLQRTAGPYKGANSGLMRRRRAPYSITSWTSESYSGNPAFRKPSIISFAFIDSRLRAIHADIVKAGSILSTRAAASRASASRPRWAKADARQRYGPG